MRSFLRRRPALPDRIALLMTGGNPATPDGAFAMFADLAGREPVARCYLSEAQIAEKSYGPALGAFSSALTAAE